MFSKKHFEALATALGEAYRELGDNADANAVKGWVVTVGQIRWTLKHNSARYDDDMFLAAVQKHAGMTGTFPIVW